jgi:hypothetical protein
LDAAFFLLYGIEWEDAEYVLSTFQAAGDPRERMFGEASATELMRRAYERLGA